MSKQRVLFVAGMSLGLLMGCGDAPEPALEMGRDVAQPMSPGVPFLPRQTRTLDEDLLEVSATVPGFAGMYYDEEGQLVVRLVPEGTGLAAEQALSARRAIVAVFGEDTIPERGMRTEPAVRTFAQLKALHERITPEVLSLAGTVLTDVDEKNNRVAIGIERAAVRPELEQVLLRLTAARDAIDIVEMSPILPTNVRGGWRPISGGLQIETSGSYCTLGFSALRGGTLGFVTNSHCTRTQGGVESTQAHQPVASDLVATEVADPGYSTGGSCPSGRVCRQSDSAFFRASVSVNPTVAMTPAPFNLSISKWLEVPNKLLKPSQGQLVHKTGRTTGTTSGTIQWACATVNSGTTPHTYFCNYIATSSHQIGGPGDSGSPVYILSGNNARLTGLMWGASADPQNFTFAPLSGVQNELGVVPYCQGFVGC